MRVVNTHSSPINVLSLGRSITVEPGDVVTMSHKDFVSNSSVMSGCIIETSLDRRPLISLDKLTALTKDNLIELDSMLGGGHSSYLKADLVIKVAELIGKRVAEFESYIEEL